MLNWSLRLRVFLLFAALGGGGAAASLAALWFSYTRVAEVGVQSGFVTAALLVAVIHIGGATAIWFLFDENVARPITGLAAGLRAARHGAKAQVGARYLGDLAPAADAVAEDLGQATLSVAEAVAAETARLEAETTRLTALLTEIPVATILLNAQEEIVLYDGQAAALFPPEAPLRLKAPIADYMALADIPANGGPVTDRLGRSLDVHRRDMAGGGALLTLHNTPQAEAKPLVYDFDLMQADAAPGLSRLSYCVVDTETTGLDPERDALVQIAAVRVVNGTILRSEALDHYVDPGRPIPAAAQAVHGVCDADVVGAPDPATAAQGLRQFCGADIFVAHNVPFDLGLLRATGVDWQVPVLDTVLLSAVIWGTTEDHTLDALCARLGITIPEALRHTALGDAEATAKALCKMLPMLEDRGITSFEQLIEECRKHGRLVPDMNAP